MDLLFEHGTSEHADELERLYNDLNDYLSRTVNYPGWIKGIYPIRQTALDGIKENQLYTLKHDNKIIATAIIRNTPEEAYYGVEWLTEDDYNQIAVVYTFAVHPDYLKQGIGREMLLRIIETCRLSGLKSIRLDVYENNAPAIKLYEKCGFQYIDTVDLGLAEYGLDRFKLYECVLSEE